MTFWKDQSCEYHTWLLFSQKLSCAENNVSIKKKKRERRRRSFIWHYYTAFKIIYRKRKLEQFQWAADSELNRLQHLHHLFKRWISHNSSIKFLYQLVKLGGFSLLFFCNFTTAGYWAPGFILCCSHFNFVIMWCPEYAILSLLEFQLGRYCLGVQIQIAGGKNFSTWVTLLWAFPCELYLIYN